MNIAVIVGTTRDGRVTPMLAKWVENRLKNKHDEVTVLDLAEFSIPVLEEAPWQPDRKLTDGAKQWLDGLAAADGYVFVTGEYNHGVPAVLKNALDYTNGQMVRKPAAIVSHGVVGGARSSEQLRLVLSSKLAVSVLPDSVTFHGQVSEAISEDGTLAEGFAHNQDVLDGHIDELIWYTKALKDARV